MSTERYKTIRDANISRNRYIDSVVKAERLALAAKDAERLAAAAREESLYLMEAWRKSIREYLKAETDMSHTTEDDDQE